MKSLPKRKHQRDQHGRIRRFASEQAHDDLQQAIADSHVADFVMHLCAAGRSPNHVQETLRVIRRVCIACKFQTSNDLDSSVLDSHLAGLIAAGKSYRTRNAALKSVRAFVRFLVKSERLVRDPFQMIMSINEQADPRRRRRRVLTALEFSQFLNAAETGPTIESISGCERATIALLAISTGLRRSEIASLTISNLSLGSTPPFVQLCAASTKAKRDTKPIPLHKFVVERLRAWLATRDIAPNEPIFHLRTRRGKLRKTSRMMKLDCEAAGIPYVSDLGTADFHSHRVAFITNLCRTADFSTAVDLARHSDPKLTAKIYDKVTMENRTAAINGLPLPDIIAGEFKIANTP